ncbi:MAG: flagellar motor protein MotB [Elusimicrobiota bacterium]
MRAKRKFVTLAEHGFGQIWLITFCDLMTNLMLFFLVMFALTRVDAAKQQQLLSGLEGRFTGKKVSIAKVQKVLEKAREESVVDNLKSNLASGDLNKIANVEIGEQQIVLTLKAPVLFGIGSANIDPRIIPALDEVAEVLTVAPNKIIVEGHTDNVPIRGGKYESNWELSVARAFSIISYFVKSKSIAPEKFIAAGYGEFRPLHPNDTEEHRVLNRRIEIKIIRQMY